jgi:hypothetical protein
MKIVVANGKKKVIITRKEWEAIGKLALWEDSPESNEEPFNPPPFNPNEEEEKAKALLEQNEVEPEVDTVGGEEKKFLTQLPLVAAKYVLQEDGGAPMTGVDPEMLAWFNANFDSDIVQKVIAEQQESIIEIWVSRMDKTAKQLLEGNLSFGDRYTLSTIEYVLSNVKENLLHRVEPGTPFFNAVEKAASGEIKVGLSIKLIAQGIVDAVNGRQPKEVVSDEVVLDDNFFDDVMTSNASFISRIFLRSGTALSRK